MTTDTKPAEQVSAQVAMAIAFGELKADHASLIAQRDALVKALDRMMNQPCNHPLSMTVEERKELWAAHSESRAALTAAKVQS